MLIVNNHKSNRFSSSNKDCHLLTVLKDIGNSVIGHRSASGVAPENTLAALKLTAKQGVGWVEFDVKITSDNITILFLDDTLMWT